MGFGDFWLNSPSTGIPATHENCVNAMNRYLDPKTYVYRLNRKGRKFEKEFHTQFAKTIKEYQTNHTNNANHLSQHLTELLWEDFIDKMKHYTSQAAHYERNVKYGGRSIEVGYCLSKFIAYTPAEIREFKREIQKNMKVINRARQIEEFLIGLAREHNITGKISNWIATVRNGTGSTDYQKYLKYPIVALAGLALSAFLYVQQRSTIRPLESKLS